MAFIHILKKLTLNKSILIKRSNQFLIKIHNYQMAIVFIIELKNKFRYILISIFISSSNYKKYYLLI